MIRRNLSDSALADRINVCLRKAGYRPPHTIIVEQDLNHSGQITWTKAVVLGNDYPEGLGRETIIGMGVSKRMNDDLPDHDLGARLAVSRAVRSYVDYQKAHGIQWRPKREKAEEEEPLGQVAGAAYAYLAGTDE